MWRRMGAARPLLAVLQALATVWLAVTLAFWLLRLLPGDVLNAQAATQMSTAQIAQQRQRLGLDQPLMAQYADYMLGLMRGDLGRSHLNGEAVGRVLMPRLWPTFGLAAGALVLALALCVPIALLATRADAWGALVRGACVVVISTPIYWTGTLAVFAWPATALSGVLWLPMLLLAVHSAAALGDGLSTQMRQVLTMPFVLYARAKGLRERRVLWAHVLKVSTPPLLPLVVNHAVVLFGGVVIIETLFMRAGLGRLLLDRVMAQDYPTVQAVVLVIVLVVMVLQGVADVAQRLLDPRFA
jgi:peptide/nickel transport system permease protein